MIRKKLIAIAAVIAMVAMIQTAQATLLSSLIANNGSLSVGDKTFSNFSYSTSLPGGGQLNPQVAGLDVTAFIFGDVYFLDFGGGLFLNNSGGTADLFGDVKLRYTVSVISGLPLINAIDQTFTGNAQLGSGNITIGETVISTSAVGSSTLSFNPVDFADLGLTTQEANDILAINPHAISLLVTKDIFMQANANSIIAMSDVMQSFHQVVPEPTTMIAGAMLLLPFGASTLRMLRKNRTA